MLRILLKLLERVSENCLEKNNTQILKYAKISLTIKMILDSGDFIFQQTKYKLHGKL